MYIADASMMKEIDRYTIEEIGIPSMVLMENASRSVVKNIVNIVSSSELFNAHILIVAGKGNNGGDGVCVARVLCELGYNASVYLVDKSGTFTNDMNNQINIAKKCGVSFLDDVNLEKYDIIIDAIFGVGLSKEIRGVYYSIIEEINSLDKLVFSVDIPSGINSTTGEVMGIAIKANYTITFGLNKVGLVLHPGFLYAGKVIVENIGFSNEAIEKVCSGLNNKLIYKVFNEKECLNYLPGRKRYSNKGSYGKVLVIAGSYNMAGACYLSAKAAYRMGAGLVKVFTVEENRQIIQNLVPEVILSTYNNKEDIDVIEKKLLALLKDADVIVLGPGMGTGNVSKQIVKYTLEKKECPCIIDADAINILSVMSENEQIQLRDVIFTPHLKELSRLIHKDMDFVKENIYNPINLYRELDYFNKEDTNDNRNILVIKDAITVTLDNREAYFNTSGNNGLATAGAGDVLTGIIAGLISGGCSNIEAASLGVYLHGLCADEYVKEYSAYSLNATDIISYLEKVLGGISDEKVL